MRNVIFILLVALMALPSFAATKRVTASANKSPDVTVYDLNTRNTVSTNDTLAAAGDMNIYGPYNLVQSNGDPMPTTIQIWGDIITGTTPTASLDYQIISSFNIADTMKAAWTAADTLGTSATNQAVTISGCGKAIVFRVNNYDATATQIPGMLRVGIKGSVTTAIKGR